MGFHETLEQLRAQATTSTEQGQLFERLMKRFFQLDPVYRDRFSNVWLWSEWAKDRPGFTAQDIGIDLVAEERGGGVCAIQCKFHGPNTKIQKPAIDSFIAASAQEAFTGRLMVDTGKEWGDNAIKTIEKVTPACQVLQTAELAKAAIHWPDLAQQAPEDIRRAEKLTLRRHQRETVHDVQKGFQSNDRGKLVMACGTGKTLAALAIAEREAGVGGRVLYLVPSISLFQQSMRAWAEQRTVPHHYVGICSDTRAGKEDEDASIQELEIPVTTNPEKIGEALGKNRPTSMTVVFSTYQSLPLVQAAQDDGAPAFNLVICDEAHRTTGVDKPGDKTSPFVLVHDRNAIRAEKRLYMTATPRLYTAGAKAKAAHHSVEVFSMDDEATYGPEFHRLRFSDAVEQDLLSDYKVVIFAMSEEHAAAALQKHLATDEGEIKLDDAAKIVGCWRALQNPEDKKPGDGPIQPLRRAIAFTNKIKSSKLVTKHWGGIVEQAVKQLPEDERDGAFRCELEHVDGQHHALDRKSRLEWLKEDSEGACRILSNARCLSEGIDVPALDAVLFLSPRNSQVDIVQAVGRAMRKAPGKKYGYIVIPIAVPAGTDPARALDDNKRFAALWGVLRALRSHDDRFNAEINKIDLNRNKGSRIILINGNGPRPVPIPFPTLDLPPGAIFAKIVEKCGDRKYWESWAKDVADIFSRLVVRIDDLLATPESDTLREWFDAFLDELKESINDSITRKDAVSMMAQHILTRPVFEALFENYDFASNNPVARALDELRKDFGEFGLENEIRDLEGFYQSVRQRARGLDNSEARQKVLMELYENFFATALKKEADRLGIVYTPVEVVDFILHSADHVLRQEFGRSLGDEGVHVMDPFTGTGIFPVRLLQSGLIPNEDLERKYREELHANEIMLLAYYIAAVHIEEAYHGRRGAGSGYEPFEGIVLTDTFNLQTKKGTLPYDWLPANSERLKRQQELPIEVIVGNPPWSAGQRSSADDNPNVAYPALAKRVAETYAARSTATLKNSLYDSYKMAIRWASDRIGKKGVIALVTNGSWIDGNADSGIRACLAEEFSSIWVLNLRGNQRTQGERSRREGGKVFGQGSRAPVAITLLVRNPKAGHDGCQIHYHDIGDYLKREDKLGILEEAESIDGISDWKAITPDAHHDWIGQRDQSFQAFYPIGSKDVKSGASEEAAFNLFSHGYKTNRDAYIYSFSEEACTETARLMVGEYMGAMQLREDDPDYTVDEAAHRRSSHLRWDRELKDRLRRGQHVVFSSDRVLAAQYRPFVKQRCYVDYVLASVKGQHDRMFPSWWHEGAEPTERKNHAILVPGIGATKSFGPLIVDTMPDVEVMTKGQCFPRWTYPQREFNGPTALLPTSVERVDNITDHALHTFREHYGDESITKDAIFDYVYGMLHAREYGTRFANDLSKGLPRIPFAPDFRAFERAGRDLAVLHLEYETCDEYPLELVTAGSEPLQSEHYRLTTRAMRYADKERTELIVNDHVRLRGIPAEAHEYEVNGRSPLGWFIDRYRIKQDRRSGIVNDPNGWFEKPEDLIPAIRRIVHVSVETVRIVAGLPTPFPANLS